MWINCEKRLPPESVTVLVTHMYWSPNQKRFFRTFVVVAQRLKNMWYDANFGQNLNLQVHLREITHWMPVPDLPEL